MQVPTQITFVDSTMKLSPERVHLFCQIHAPVLSNTCTCFVKRVHLFFHTLPGNSNSSNSSFYKTIHAYVCTYAGDFSLFFTVPSVTVPYLFLVTGDMVTIELVNIPCVRMRVRTQECFFLFLLSPRHLVIFRSTSGPCSVGFAIRP